VLSITARGESLDGWLFYNFRHRDPLADGILGLDPGTKNTRPWIYALPSSGEALKIVHGIEPGILDELPGTTTRYVDRKAFAAALAPLAGKRWAAHWDENLPVVSFLDAGTAALLERAGLELVSAAPLLQRFKGLLDEEGIASHERAAEALYSIVEESWSFIDGEYRAGREVREGQVRRLILEGMARRGVETDHPPIVACGSHAGDPHYDFTGEGERFKPGDVIQLDLWAKERTAGSIYADISWVGVFGPEADSEVEAAWKVLRQARDGAVAYAESELAEGRRPTGASVDAAVRSILIGAGYGEAIRHRTGHGIDTECHGSGVNMDSVEFPDERLLLDGACFSVEPGLYFSRFGLRTEIDVYIRSGRTAVSGGKPQRELLRCGRSVS